jgi:hypothetical protein
VSNRKVLRNNEQTRTGLRLNELTEVSRHGRLVVSHEDAAIACGARKDFLIGEGGRPAAVAVLKSISGTRLSTADTMIWLRSASAWKRIAIQRVSGVCFLASASF